MSRTQQAPVPSFGTVSRVDTGSSVHLARASHSGLVRLLCNGAFKPATLIAPDTTDLSCRRCKRIHDNLSAASS